MDKMENYLDRILAHKRKEVAARKALHPLSDLSSLPLYSREVLPFTLPADIKKPGLIAEFKRRSPSKGDINASADPVEVAGAYAAAGVVAMSVLTDEHFFGGDLFDLLRVRKALPDLVLLRKDFIVDPYQLHEARAFGADMVLLIAAALSRAEVEALTAEAGSLGLQILFEVHHRDELEKFCRGITCVGVNNRDLKSFRVDLATSLSIASDMPEGVIPVSESGIRSAEDVAALMDAGYRGFLMGEHFMRESDPGMACRNFLQSFGS